MLEDISNKLNNDISNERRDREFVEETLVKLIEETCSKIESSISR